MTGDPLRERVLAIVSIIAQYVMEDRDKLSESEIVEELLDVGFKSEEIEAAFRWMEDVSMRPPGEEDDRLSIPTNRIFSPEEIDSISLEARGFLTRMRAAAIIDDDSQEEIIARALQIADDKISLKEIKTLCALALFARAQSHGQGTVECFMEEDWPRLYH